MQESLVKLVLGLVGLASLALGIVFLFFPGWFVTFSGSEAVNVGWLRGIGGGLIAVQGFGLLIAAFRRRDTNSLVGIAAFASTLQSIGLWIAVFTGGYSATASWTTIVPGIVATVAAVLLWFAWFSRRRSLAGLSPKKQKPSLPDQDAGAIAGQSIPTAQPEEIPVDQGGGE
jgi:hypothetical protein